MATPNLSTDLPWQGLAAGGNALSGLGGDPQAAQAQLGQNYQQQYGAALGMNQALFSGAQTGYENLRSATDQNYQDILGGYSQLYGDVLGRIAGTNDTNIRDINTQYNAQQGAQNQNAVSRGLGNSTVQQNMQRGVELDRARAITGSQNQFAQLGAGYAANIGSQRLGAQQQGVNLGASLGQAQLGMLERVNAGYPDAGMYSSLAQQYGASAERDKNRQAQQAALTAASRGQMSSAGTSSPASPFGQRPLGGGGGYNGGGAGQVYGSGYGGYSNGGGYAPAYGAGWLPQGQVEYQPMGNSYDEVNNEWGGGDFGGDWGDYGGGNDFTPMDQYGGYDNSALDQYGLTDYDYFG